MLTHPPKLISRKETKLRTSLSEREQKRREAQGRFPQPLKLGRGANGRVAHVESEIDAWVSRQIAERDRQRSAAAADDGVEPRQTASAP
jgi:predicted DNA-binding transcriptional regulator AlpA